MARSSVGFIGLGRMGGHMARSLIRGGKDVIVFDVNKEAMHGFPKHVVSPNELTANCGVIFTMLPSGNDVRSVYIDDGLLEGSAAGSTLIDCSTVEPHVEREVYHKAKERGVNFMDAPVSGGVKGAEAGTLSFMVGGDKKNFEEQFKLFKLMGEKIIHCGEIGNGQIAKICNNLILGISMVGLAEALNLGKKLGVDPAILSSIVNSSSGRSWCSEIYNPYPGIISAAPSSNNYSGGFSTRLMAKDLRLAQSCAKEANISLPLGVAASEIYQQLLSDEEFSNLDFSAIYKWLAYKK